MNRPVLSRIGRVSPGRLALAGLFVGLLVVAAGLRFYDLPGNSLSHDEAAAANISRGALSEVIPGTRTGNSSPILYPLTLWVVQQVESTPFSVRLLPAAASVLTVAAMLFLLPRLGVNRWAAFLAALLATLSVAAIEQAQDTREYSLDALLAALLIAGLLWYLRDGKKILLCVALFLAPLFQYGLVLFGGAVLVAAIILPSPPTFPVSEGNSHLNRVRNWLKGRLALVGPAGCFLAGCVLSYAVTLRYQWRFGPDSYLAEYYYPGKFDAPAIFEFSINGIWRLLTYHLPEGVAIAALVALALLLVATLFRKVQSKLPERAIAVLFSLCLAISVGAALLGLYPLGDTRQVIYLGPIVFLAVGVALHCTAESLAGLTRRRWRRWRRWRGWLTPALVVAVAGAIALAGVGELRQDSPYRTDENIKSVLAVLKERVREDDLVYAGKRVVPALRFYQEERPANYYYGNASCHGSAELCLRDLADLDYWLDVGNGRIWFVTYNRSPALANNLRGLSVERLGGGKKPELYLIGNGNELIAKAREQMLPPKPILLIRADFDVYRSENTLVYIKKPCAPADIKARFFLHLYPVDGADLPATRQQHGFDNLDFRFDRHGGIINGKCMAARTLPEYAINRIHTGQYVPVGGGFERLWEGEFLYNAVE